MADSGWIGYSGFKASVVDAQANVQTHMTEIQDARHHHFGP